MRYKHPRVGDARIVKKFLIMPRRIDFETRWLSFEKISQEFMHCMKWLSSPVGPPSPYRTTDWVDVAWVD